MFLFKVINLISRHVHPPPTGKLLYKLGVLSVNIIAQQQKHTTKNKLNRVSGFSIEQIVSSFGFIISLNLHIY